MRKKIFLILGVPFGFIFVLALAAYLSLVPGEDKIEHKHLVFDDSKGRDTKLPPINPFLAQSTYPMAHANPALQDSVWKPGPTGPTGRLDFKSDVIYTNSGPFQFGQYTSSPFEDGRRVLWASGADRIVKFDYSSREVIDTYALDDGFLYENSMQEEIISNLNKKSVPQQYLYILTQLAPMLMDLSGVYTLLDINNEFYVGGYTGNRENRSITVYGDSESGNPNSPIEIKRVFEMPSEVSGSLVGMNMSFDGNLIVATEHGDVLVISRDFSSYSHTKLKYSEEADKSAPNGYGWVRNAFSLDEDGGIYIVSQDHLHKLIWDGSKLSKDENEGAWSVRYNNERGNGSGASPSLMGFENSEKFVVITDGDEIMNIVLYWRDEIPEDWIQLPGTKSRRVAGILPADMGGFVDEVQSEQSVIVMGYSAVVVNNEPQNIPKWLRKIDPRISALITGFIGNDPAIQPYGMEKFTWSRNEQKLKTSWINTKISSLNALPIASYGSNMIYTVGARDGIYTLEGIDWDSGSSVFHWELGGHIYNTLYSGLLIDEEGQIHYTSLWGKMNLQPSF